MLSTDEAERATITLPIAGTVMNKFSLESFGVFCTFSFIFALLNGPLPATTIFAGFVN